MRVYVSVVPVGRICLLSSTCSSIQQYFLTTSKEAVKQKSISMKCTLFINISENGDISDREAIKLCLKIKKKNNNNKHIVAANIFKCNPNKKFT